MKFKMDFVTNSSSTSFIITNKSKNSKTLADLIKEHLEFIEDYNALVGRDITYKQIEKCAKDIKFRSKESRIIEFYDDEMLGAIMCYALQENIKCKDFKWQYHSSNR